MGQEHLGRHAFLSRRRWLALVAGSAVGVRAFGNAGDIAFARRAMQLRDEALRAGDQPYGAVVVRDGKVLAEAPSRVITARDPTAHAEMEAIREAARKLGTQKLSGCDLYGSSRACRMCEGAAYWAGIRRLFHGSGAAGGEAPRL